MARCTCTWISNERTRRRGYGAGNCEVHGFDPTIVAGVSELVPSSCCGALGGHAPDCIAWPSKRSFWTRARAFFARVLTSDGRST
jgi:hypothetical protein